MHISGLNSREHLTRCGPSAWGLGREGLTAHNKKPAFYETLHRGSDLPGCYEHGNEPWGSIKVGKFLTS
jgi:hypothetical protein